MRYRCLTLLTPVEELGFLPVDPYTLYAATYVDGLQYSADGGQTWTRMPGMPDNSHVPAVVPVGAGDRAIVYAGTSGGVVRVEKSNGRNIAKTGAGTRLIGLGVYRLVTRHGGEKATVYLPIVLKH